jgi:hypothetical protein
MPELSTQLQDVLRNIESAITETTGTKGPIEAGEIKTQNIERSIKKITDVLYGTESAAKKAEATQKAYLKRLYENSDILKELGEDFDSFAEKIISTKQATENLKATFTTLTNVAKQTGDALAAGPEAMIKSTGKAVGEFATKSLSKIHPALGLASEAIQAGIKWWLAVSKEISDLNKNLLVGSRSIRIYRTTNDQARNLSIESLKTEIETLKKLGISSDDVRKRINTLIEAGFSPLENAPKSLLMTFTMLREGLGLSDAAIQKTTKVLRREYNLGLKDTLEITAQMTDQWKDYNVTASEVVGFQIQMLEKGRDYGLSLKEIQKEMDNAQKAGLSFAQSQRQATELTTKSHEMGMEKQLFLARKLGYNQMEAFEAIGKMRFGKFEAGGLGTKMMEEVARMAGLGEVTGGFAQEGRGLSRDVARGQTERFAFFAQRIFGISREVAETWARGGKEVENQRKGIQRITRANDKHYNELMKLTDQYGKVREAGTKLWDSFVGFAKRVWALPLTPPGAMRPEGEIGMTEEQIQEASRKQMGQWGLKVPQKSEEEQIIKIRGHSGGYIPPGMSLLSFGGYYHNGGEVNATLKEKEFVTNANSVAKIGLENMNYMNETGEIPQAGGGEVTVNMEGIITEELGKFLQPFIQQFFQEKVLGMA